jgi:glucan-binding YG repeat protein
MLEYENLNLSQIKELCGERHLSKEGTKADLLERIKEYEERQAKIKPGLFQIEELCQMKIKEIQEIIKKGSKFSESGRRKAPKTTKKEQFMVQLAGFCSEKPTIEEVDEKVKDFKESSLNKELAEYLEEEALREEDIFKRAALKNSSILFYFYPKKFSSGQEAHGLVGISTGIRQVIDDFFNGAERHSVDDEKSRPNKKQKTE